MPTADRPSFEIPASVLFREVDRQMVLLNVETEQYYGVDEVGADIVARLLQDPLDRVLASLADDYEVDPEILSRDVDNLVRALIDAGLFVRVENAP